MAKFGFSKEGNLKEIRRGDAALRTLLLPVNKFDFSDLSIFDQNLRYDTDQRLDFIPHNHKFLVPINSPNVGPATSTIFIRGISDVSPNVVSGTKNLSIEIGDGVLCSPNSDIVAGGSFSLNKIVSVTKPVEGLNDIGTVSLSSQIRNGEGAADESEFYSASNKPNGYVGGGVIQAFKNRRNENEKIAIIKQNLASYDSASGRFTFGTDIDLTFTEGDFISKINVKGHSDSPFDIVGGSTYFNKRIGDTKFGSSFYPLVVSEYNINNLGQTSFVLKRPETNSPVLFNKLKVGHENVYGHNLVLGKVLQVNELEGGTFSAPEQNDKEFGTGIYPAISQSSTHPLVTTGSGTGLQISIKTQNLRVIKVTVIDSGTGHAIGDEITCPKENILGAVNSSVVVNNSIDSTNPQYNGTYVYDVSNDVWYNQSNSDFSDNKGYFFFSDSANRWQFGSLMSYAKGNGSDAAVLPAADATGGIDEATGFWSVDTNANWTGGSGVAAAAQKLDFVHTSTSFASGSGTLDLKFKIASATTIYNAESPQLMIFNSPNIIQFTRQLPVSDSDLRGLVPPILRAQGGPRSLIKLGDDQVAGSGSVKSIYRHFESLGEMYNLSGTNDSFSNTESSWQDKLIGHTLKDVIGQIQGEVNVAEENSLQKISSVEDNINTSSEQLVIDGALQIQDPVGVNDIANLADNVFNNCPHAPAVYIKEEDADNPGTFSYTRAFSTFDGPWTADISAGKKHIRTFETDDQTNAEFVTTLNIGKLEFVDRFVIEDYASKNITEPDSNQGGGLYVQNKVNAPAGAFSSSLNSPRSTGFTHKMPIVIKEKDSTTGEENDVTYFLLLKGPLT